MRLSLPLPNLQELAHSERVVDLIRSEIRANGSIPFARFMELALYAPGLGYYSAGLPKFGNHGDFITAPELGSLFAQCIAHAVLPTLREVVEPTILEIGPGSGALAAEILLELDRHNGLPKRYWLLERSADLRARQHEIIFQRCPQFIDLIEWLDVPPVSAWQGVFLANEVVDALPVTRFALKEEGVFTEHVRLGKNQGLVLCDVPANQHDLTYIENLLATLPEPLPRPYRSEFLPELPVWFAAVAGKLERGLGLFIDYGYPRQEFYSRRRNEGTLRCYYRHRIHSNPLCFPGLQDITASVDFTALHNSVEHNGFNFENCMTQSEFLMSNRIIDLFQRSQELPQIDQFALNREIKKLIFPDQMGESFHVVKFQRGLSTKVI